MRYAFIINPVSGNGKTSAKFFEELKQVMADDERDIKYYLTEGIGDGAVIASRLAIEAEEAEDPITIYACGGDGTLNEVVNGIVGCEYTYFGAVPVGSGNDFVRNFEGADFLDVRKQLDAEVRDVDLVRFTYDSEEGTVDKYYINGMNIGLDGNTAILSNSLRQHPLINGSFSYLMAIAFNLIKKNGADLKVTADGELVHEGKAIMCTASNGRFCGGGIESCPRAVVDNGLIELLIIKDITRRMFFKVFPAFMKGKVFEIPDIEEIVSYVQPEHIEIEPAGGKMQFVVDGEEYHTGSISVDIMKKALKLVVPTA